MIGNIDHRLQILRELAITKRPRVADVNIIAQCLYEVLKHLEVNGTIKPRIVGAGVQETLFGEKEIENEKIS